MINKGTLMLESTFILIKLGAGVLVVIFLFILFVLKDSFIITFKIFIIITNSLINNGI